MGIKKIVLSTIVAAALAFGAVAMVGCGGSNPEQEVRAAATADLDLLKNMDDAVVSQMAGVANESDAQMFELVGLTPEDVIRAYLEGFDYTIDEVTVDGDTAQVTATLTVRSSSDLTSAMNGVYDTIDYTALFETGDMTVVGDALLEAIASVEPTPQASETVTYENVDGT